MSEVIKIPNHIKELVNEQYSYEDHQDHARDWFARQMEILESNFPTDDEIKHRERVNNLEEEYKQRLEKAEENHKKNLADIRIEESPVSIKRSMYIGDIGKYKDINCGFVYYIISEGDNINIYTNHTLDHMLDDIEFIESEWKDF